MPDELGGGGRVWHFLGLGLLAAGAAIVGVHAIKRLGLACNVGQLQEKAVKEFENLQVLVRRCGNVKGAICRSRQAQGLSEFEVMTLAGHAMFETTHRFYLAVAQDILDRA